MIRTINALLHAVGLDASSIGTLLLSLSTIAGAKISNPSWVNFQSAGWVSFQSAPTGIPNIDSSDYLDYTVLAGVIKHILETPSPFSRNSKLISPDFDEKIVFNDLEHNGDWLRAKQREVWQIDDYFSKNSDFAKQTLRDSLAAYYAESVISVPSASAGSSAGDLRFAYILEKIAPHHPSPSVDRLRKDAALVLMSKYFETCDIFEEPKNVFAS
ncbi:ABC-three component system protein [Pseudomonas amygdali]